MVSLMNMRTVEYPSNALLDVPGLMRPLTNALQNYTQGINEAEVTAYNRDQAKEQQSYTRGRQAKQDQIQLEERIGSMALAGTNLPKGDPRRVALHRRILSQHPNAASLGPEYQNPDTAFDLIAADYGKWKDPREEEMADLKMRALKADVAKAEAPPVPKYERVENNLLRVGPDGKPEVVFTAPKQEDPIDAFIRQRLNQGAQPQAQGFQPQSAPGTGGATLQPMSNQQTAPPMLQTVADEAPAQAAPPQTAEPDMVDIPMFGRMPRQEAQELGMMLQMSPKYSNLGKSILEQYGGGPGGANIPKPAENQLAERVISAAGVLGRVADVRKQFRPEFQQIPERLKMYGASWGAAFGAKLPPDVEKQLSDYAEYRATAFDNFNQILKELSGTAVSAQELERQKLVQPNPGQGLLDGDDPVTLNAKLDRAEKTAKTAMARMNYMRSRGLEFNKDTAEQFIRLDDVPRLVERRGAEIEAEIRRANPKADPMSIEKQTQQRLRQEFGI